MDILVMIWIVLGLIAWIPFWALRESERLPVRRLGYALLGFSVLTYGMLLWIIFPI